MIVVSLALAQTIPVQPGGLAAALTSSPPGSVLVLEPGQHPGPITITSPMTLVGAPGVVVQGSPGSPAITIQADVTLASLEVASDVMQRGIRVVTGHLVLDDVRMNGSGDPFAVPMGGLIDVTADGSLEVIRSALLMGAASQTGGQIHAVGPVSVRGGELRFGSSLHGAAISGGSIDIRDAIVGNRLPSGVVSTARSPQIATSPFADCVTGDCGIVLEHVRFEQNFGIPEDVVVEVGRAGVTGTYGLVARDVTFTEGPTAVFVSSPADTVIERTAFCRGNGTPAAIQVDQPGTHAWSHVLVHATQPGSFPEVWLYDGDVSIAHSSFITAPVLPPGPPFAGLAIRVEPDAALVLRHDLLGGRAGNAVAWQGASVTFDHVGFFDNGSPDDTNPPPGGTTSTGLGVPYGDVPESACLPDELTLLQGHGAIDGGDGTVQEADGSAPDLGVTGGDPAWCVQVTAWRDLDGDGAGDDGHPYIGCHPPPSYATVPGDCDDLDPARAPGMTEVACTGIDEDCDPSTVDEVDEDEDSYACDCDETDELVNPGATEACNGVDDDCDGDLDEGFPQSPWYPDADDDGYGDDAAPAVQACAAPGGHVDVQGDCDDGDPDVSPDDPEVCNGVDDDCDGSADDGLAVSTWYADGDGDGFGGEAVEACAQPAGTVSDDGDCDDGRADVHPGTQEDGDPDVDADCDGHTDPTGRLATACATGSRGAVPLGLLAVLALRRRR